MKIDFEYKGKSGLKIIKEIGEGKIVWIRGYNGVGKSLAAKLLEIGSGSHVFDSRSEFESLKSSLESATMTIDLDDKSCLSLRINPSQWRFDENSRSIIQDTVGQFFEDNTQISSDQLNKRFEARIIRGNESLQTQISTLIIDSRDYFRKIKSQLVDFKSFADKFVRETDENLAFNMLDRYKRSGQELEKQNQFFLQSVGELQIGEKALDLVTKLLDVQGDIELVKKNDPTSIQRNVHSRDEQIRKLDNSVNEAMRKRDEFNAELGRLITDEKAKYDSVSLRLKDLRRDIEDTTRQIIEMSTQSLAGVTHEVLFDDNKLLVVIADKQHELMEKERKTQNEMAELSAIGEILNAQGAIRHALTIEAENYDVGHETIAHGRPNDIDKEIDVTVNELREMVRTQERILESKKRDLLYEDLERTNILIATEQQSLDSLKKLAMKRRKYKKNAETLQKQIDNLQVGDKSQWNTVKSKIESVNAAISEIQMERGILTQQNMFDQALLERYAHTRPATELEKQRQGILAKLRDLNRDLIPIDLTSIVNEQNELRGLLASKRLELRGIEKSIGELKDEKRTLEHLFQRKLEEIKKESRFQFLLDWISTVKEQDTPALFEELRQKVNGFYDVIGEVVTRLDEVLDYHEALMDVQASKSTRLAETEGLKRLENIFNGQLKEFYSNSIFLKYAFEGFESIESFSLRTNEITLIDPKGLTQTKPISSFSTGQKAFAFSIAMMAIVFHHNSENGVLILDEFGALLDFMREDVLMAQVKKRILETGVAQKIVILLPVRERLDIDLQNRKQQLSSIPAGSEISSLLRAEMKTIEKRLQQLTEDGYYQYRQDVDEPTGKVA